MCKEMEAIALVYTSSIEAHPARRQTKIQNKLYQKERTTTTYKESRKILHPTR